MFYGLKEQKRIFSDAYIFLQNLISYINDSIQTVTHCEFSDSKSDGLGCRTFISKTYLM